MHLLISSLASLIFTAIQRGRSIICAAAMGSQGFIIEGITFVLHFCQSLHASCGERVNHFQWETPSACSSFLWGKMIRGKPFRPEMTFSREICLVRAQLVPKTDLSPTGCVSYGPSGMKTIVNKTPQVKCKKSMSENKSLCGNLKFCWFFV